MSCAWGMDGTWKGTEGGWGGECRKQGMHSGVVAVR